MFLSCTVTGSAVSLTPIPWYWCVEDHVIHPSANADLDSPIPCLTQIVIVILDATDPQAGPTWWSHLMPKAANQINGLHQRFNNDHR
eukprot:scaffold101589_cov36-Cyclotella_meneghiniana.AAC.7